jgi:hypothetical protein
MFLFPLTEHPEGIAHRMVRVFTAAAKNAFPGCTFLIHSWHCRVKILAILEG